MNRRAFAASLAAGILLPRLHQTAAQTSTPTVMPRPLPIDLGEGMALIDYRVHPGDLPAVIGELQNTRDHMVDAPVLSLSWPQKTDDSAFAWASPMIPVIEPGGSVPIFGTLPAAGDPAELLTEAKFALCTPVEAGEYTSLEQRLDLEVRMMYERHRPVAFKGSGSVTNLASRPAMQVSVHGVVRDGEGRIAGMTPTAFWYAIPASEVREFTIWIADTLPNKANPVPLLSGLDYSVEVTAGTRGPAIAPACVFGKPWE